MISRGGHLGSWTGPNKLKFRAELHVNEITAILDNTIQIVIFMQISLNLLKIKIFEKALIAQYKIKIYTKSEFILPTQITQVPPLAKGGNRTLYNEALCIKNKKRQTE